MRRQRERLEALRAELRVGADAYLILQEELDFLELSLSIETDRHIEKNQPREAGLGLRRVRPSSTNCRQGRMVTLVPNGTVSNSASITASSTATQPRVPSAPSRDRPCR